MDKYDIIEKKLCEELDVIGRKFEGGEGMNPTDLDRIDRIVHALKSMATYRAMVGAEEHNGMNGKMGRPYNDNDSFAEGYNRGFSDAKNGYIDWHSMMYPSTHYGHS